MIRNIMMIGIALAALQLVAVMGNVTENSQNFVDAEFVSRKINDFSFDLIQEFREKKINLALSPISVWTVMSMALLGSESSTRSELLRGLYLNNHPLNVSLPEIKKLINGLNAKSVAKLTNTAKSDPALELHLANKIYLQHTLKIEEMFRREIESYDIASFESVDFGNVGKASETINDWVARQTNSRIKDIINPSNINEQTAMVLVNTLYFKGTWKHPFPLTDTVSKDFYLRDGTTKQVPMMSVIAEFKYGVNPQERFSFIELPFKTPRNSETVSMFVIIPDTIADFETAERNIKNSWLNDLRSGNESNCLLYLPKFTIESAIDLRSPLKNLKMGSIFENSANFSRISKSPLKVSNIIQKVFIDVNEKGIEAAAGTAMTLQLLSLPLFDTSVTVDKPFLFLICTEKVILFSAKILDPTQQKSTIASPHTGN